MDLAPVDSLEVLVIVDNEVDPISRYVPQIVAYGNLAHVGLGSPYEPWNRGENVKELRLDDVCCGAHGLAYMIVC